jgi:hypothetical protein
LWGIFFVNIYIHIYLFITNKQINNNKRSKSHPKKPACFPFRSFPPSSPKHGIFHFQVPMRMTTIMGMTTGAIAGEMAAVNPMVIITGC